MLDSAAVATLVRELQEPRRRVSEEEVRQLLDGCLLDGDEQEK
jgi:hypothetical protein